MLFALAIVAIGYATWWLGGWQFGRLDDRQARNAVVRANEDRPPTPVEAVLAVGRSTATDDEWRVVTAAGTYATDEAVVVRYRTRDGESGADVVVPLLLDDGTTLLVDRGWLPAANGGQGLVGTELPEPPDGRVEVTGWVRRDGTGDSTRVDDLSTRAISSAEIGAAIGRPTLGGFVELRSESPGPAAGEPELRGVELPELDNGPHFFYGLQWWFFGLLALFGFFYLMYDEWRGGPRGRRDRPTPQPTPGRTSTPQRARALSPSQARRAARRSAVEAGLVKARAEKAASKSR